jgi:hypothetical protein
MPITAGVCNRRCVENMLDFQLWYAELWSGEKSKPCVVLPVQKYCGCSKVDFI